MNKLQVNFQFLCAFVPDRAFGSNDPPPKRFTVLMRNLSPPPMDEGEWPDGGPQAHIAHLHYHNGHGPGEIYDQENGFERILRLNGEVITFRPDSRDPAAGQLHIDVSPASQHSFLKLIHMKEVAPGKEWVKESFLSGEGPHDPQLAARVDLTEGTLYAGRMTPEQFLLRGGIRRKIALSATLEIYFAETVDIRLAKFGDANDFREVTLRPDPDDAFEPNLVRIYLRNSESEHLFGDRRDPTGPYGGRDDDFQLYYKLSSKFSDNDPWTVPTGAADIDGSHGACSPLAFEGYEV